jgi:hypothetical protein
MCSETMIKARLSVALEARLPVRAAPCLLAFSALCCGAIGPAGPRYALPIALGSSVNEVRNVLGGPTEIVRDSETRRRLQQSGVQASLIPTTDNTIEWYYSSGIVATFDRDRLSRITLHSSAPYQGFIVYKGDVVNGVTLADVRVAVVRKLGQPDKIEEDPLPADVDPDVPEVWPKESRYYWRLKDYAVEVRFLRQAQKLDATHVLKKDAVISIDLAK